MSSSEKAEEWIEKGDKKAKGGFAFFLVEVHLNGKMLQNFILKEQIYIK